MFHVDSIRAMTGFHVADIDDDDIHYRSHMRSREYRAGKMTSLKTMKMAPLMSLNLVQPMLH